MIGKILEMVDALRKQGCPNPIGHLRGECSCAAKKPDLPSGGCGSACGCGSGCSCEGDCSCG